MPIKEMKNVTKINNNLFCINLEGITHLVYDKQLKVQEETELKQLAKKLLEKENLLYSVPAAGVMFIEEQNSKVILKPIVWVRDIETLLYETACASGTAAVGLWRFAKNGSMETEVEQPSRRRITASIIKRSNNQVDVVIAGKVKILKSATIQSSINLNYEQKILL
jgi:diaminopimelate epimerase